MARHTLVNLLADCSKKWPDNFNEIFQTKSNMRKYLKRKMLFRTLPTNLLQTFCEIFFHFQDIVSKIQTTTLVVRLNGLIHFLIYRFGGGGGGGGVRFLSD